MTSRSFHKVLVHLSITLKARSRWVISSIKASVAEIKARSLKCGEESPRVTAKINAIPTPNAKASFLLKVRDTCTQERVSSTVTKFLREMATEAGHATRKNHK